MAFDIKEHFNARNKRGKIAVLAAAVILVGLVVFLARNYFLGREATDDAFIDGHIIAISPKVSGHIAKVYITDNQVVRAGDALFDIDARDYNVRRDMARAQLAEAQAQVEQAEKDFVRYQKLKETGDVSAQRFDQALFDLHLAQAKQNAAAARVAQAELEVSYTNVTAPVGGRVARKSVEEGAFVQIGQVLLALVPPERWVTANFKETQLTQMRPGQKAVIRVDAYPGLKISGRVDSVQMGTGSKFSLLPAENATGNFIKVVQRVPVKIIFDPSQHIEQELPLGLSVIPTVFIR